MHQKQKILSVKYLLFVCFLVLFIMTSRARRLVFLVNSRCLCGVPDASLHTVVVKKTYTVFRLEWRARHYL